MFCKLAPSTQSRQKTELFFKQGYLKTPTLHFIVEGKHFVNGGFRKP